MEQIVLKADQEIRQKSDLVNFIGNNGKVFNEASRDLLNILKKKNSKVREIILRKFLGIYITPDLEEYVYKYFIAKSSIAAATVANCGSSITTEFLYNGLLLSSSIDRYFLRCKSGKAIKSRLIAIEEYLPGMIQDYLKKNKNYDILIGNLGSGPGRDVINVIASHSEFNRVRILNIDKDELSLKRGERIAYKKGVSSQIGFIRTDFLRYNPIEKFDIILLVGITCPLTIDDSILVIKTAKRMLKEGGSIIVSNSTSRMKEEDPFTCFLMEWLSNWCLVYKDEPEMRQIFERAGLKWKDKFFDEFGFHIIAIGASL